MATVVENMNALKMTHFNIWDIPEDPAIFARWYNRTQEAAEKTRLGIPITIASDPRHHLGKNVIGMSSTGFSQFCEMPGFAAIGDENLVKQFAEIVRQEYMAIGIREALHPRSILPQNPDGPGSAAILAKMPNSQPDLLSPTSWAYRRAISSVVWPA